MEPVLCYQLDGPLPEAELRVREALARQGFGILTEVDVTAVLKAKLGIESRPYKILGACNPVVAHRAMEADPRVGAFLPCGLALWEEGDGTTTACLQDPGFISHAFAAEGLAEAAAEAAARLRAALEGLSVAAAA